MGHTRLALLLDRALANTISSEERQELHGLIADPKHQAEVEQLLTQRWEAFDAAKPVFADYQAADMLQAILTSTRTRSEEQPTVRPIRSLWIKVVAAVILVAVVSIGYYYYREIQEPSEWTLAEAAERYHIQPGSEKAVLTMGDGRTILLDDAANGLLAEEAGVDVNKTDDGQLRYDSDGPFSAKPVYHTITIPKGGQYKLVLPDGSTVHLNAESSLRYPVQFSGDKREVELVGEGYFDVSSKPLSGSNQKIPFIVRTATQQVEVLGTIFNIHAYEDADAVKTTLLAGRVKVQNKTGESLLLNPGEAAINDSGSNLRVVEANVDMDVAWQRGYFVFENEDIKNIMIRVARWYDVQVAYEGNVQDKRFGGIFQRSKSIVQLLENFKETGLVDFKIKERRVVVVGK